MAHDPLFDSAWFKWANALVHAQALQEDIASRDEADIPSFGFRTHYDAKRHGFAVVVAEVEPMPMRWRLLLGDIANNYRATLDHLAWALALRGRTPPESGKLTAKQENAIYFPIMQHRGGFNGELARKLPGVRRADIAKVRRRQPYHYSPRNRARHALVLLSRVNTGDKHRTVRPIWTQPTRVDIEITDAQDCVVSGQRFGRRRQAIEVGAEIAFVCARRTGSNPELHVKLGVTAEPSLGESLSVKDWLARCGILIFKLLSEFSDQPPGLDQVGAVLTLWVP